MNTGIFLQTAFSVASEAAQFEFNYFFKSVNTPSWYWLFRIAFILGLILSIAVYLYYRAKDK